METSYQENYSKQLQRLLNAVSKTQKNYTEASDSVDSADLKNLFNTYSDERRSITAELRDALQKLGGQSSEANEPESAPHHWNSTKTAENTKHDQSVLEKLRNSERETLDAYDDVLQGTILEEFNLKTLIMSQRLIINEAFTDLDRRYFDMFKLSQPY